MVLLPNPVIDEEAKEGLEFSAEVLDVRLVDAAEQAASRIWIDNWHRMLPSIVASRGLVLVSLLDAVERFVASPKPLLAIEREFSKGDPVLVRAAVFSLLQTGRVGCRGIADRTIVVDDKVCAWPRDQVDGLKLRLATNHERPPRLLHRVDRA
ncbi:hypothetical protein [Cupriavidus necator]|uniref:hypothetical protein n=1 Tax=Cupriavidus necator TaxID=106590 RepID=UPI000690FA43|nr:hypothetical protein [Cupriavidus necator]